MYRNIFRNLVVGAENKVPLKDGRYVTAVNFDNAATTPPFVSVMNEIVNFAPWYSSVHRGAGYKSQVSSDRYEKARQTVCSFCNADSDYYTVIFVKNTTEAINKLSYRLCDNDPKCVILSTCMEHHSNDLPWRNKYKVDYIDIDSEGRLNMENLEYKLKKHRGNVKLVTITGASNVTGYINPIHSAAEIIHRHGAKICVDGAQLIPHMPVDMGFPGNGYIDYLAFSAHKMYAPFGTGVLVGLKGDFAKSEPEYVGGGTVKVVTPDYVKWDDPPYREEAGSPNIMGALALEASIKTLKMTGMRNIEAYERSLTAYALSRFENIPDIILYGSSTANPGRLGIIPFNIKGVPHGITAEILSDEAGISVRNGCFCAQPYIQKLLKIGKEEIDKFINDPDIPRPGMVRVSFGLYNDYYEIDKLAETLKFISVSKEYYLKKYEKFV